MNCPRCNMFLAQGAQFCPNCQLNLAQFQYQQQQPPNFYAPPAQMDGAPETTKEQAYKKVLMGIVFLAVGQMIVSHGPDWLGGWLYSITRYLNWLLDIAWAGLPLFISIVLSKKTQIRVLLIVLSSLYAAISLYYFVQYEFMYYGWGDSYYDSY